MDGSGSVCLYVTGTGLHVDSVKLTKLSQYSWTSYPTIEIGSPVDWASSGPTLSGSKGQTISKSSVVNMSFPNNSKACGWFTDHPGLKACVTIHS